MKLELLYRIKYDKKDKKVGSFFVLFATGLTVLIFIIYTVIKRMGYVSSELTVYLTLSMVFLPVTDAACWIYYLEVCTYLKRLKRHGYVVPNDKRYFSCNLELLPRDGTNIKSIKNSRESWVLTVLCLVCFFGVMAIMTYYLLNFRNKWDYVWYMAWDVGILLFIVMLIVAFLWLLGVFVYWNQRRCDKYRDDVETDKIRKVRRNLADGIIIVIFMLAVTLYVIRCFVSMADYAMDGRVDAVSLLIMGGKNLIDAKFI